MFLIKSLAEETRERTSAGSGRFTHTPSGCVCEVPHRSGIKKSLKMGSSLLLLLLILLQALALASSAPPLCDPGFRGTVSHVFLRVLLFLCGPAA